MDELNFKYSTASSTNGASAGGDIHSIAASNNDGLINTGIINYIINHYYGSESHSKPAEYNWKQILAVLAIGGAGIGITYGLFKLYCSYYPLPETHLINTKQMHPAKNAASVIPKQLTSDSHVEERETMANEPQERKKADITNTAFKNATRAPGDNTPIKVKQELYKGALPASNDLNQNVAALLALQMGATEATNTLTKTVENIGYEGIVPSNTSVSQGLANYTFTPPAPQPAPNQQPLNMLQNPNLQTTNSFNPQLSQAQLAAVQRDKYSPPSISAETQIEDKKDKKDESAENQRKNHFLGK